MSKKAKSGKKSGKGNKKKAIPGCPKCGCKITIKSGYIDDEQRWKCKECEYQFTRMTPRGKPLWQKSLAVFLYSYGVSLHNIARIFDIQPSTVLKWVRSYAKDFHSSQEKGSIVFMDVNEMKRHLKKLDSPTMLIAINDKIFKKSLGINISSDLQN